MKFTELLDSIKSQHEAVSKQVVDLKAKQKVLKKAGIEYGTPSYKEGRYLRIIRPANAERGRKFDYIGADPDKQKAVLDAIGRGKQFDLLGSEIASLEEALGFVESELSHLSMRFKWKHGIDI